MAYILLIIGFALLVKGADYFVDGAASIAYQFHIPTVIVGLTIVALGTSLPEFAVSMSAALAGSNSLALSNVIGSNIFNTLVVVGVSGLMAPFVIDRQVANRDLGVNIFVTLLLAALAMTGSISRVGGILFLVLLCAYIVWLVIAARKQPLEEDVQEEEKILPPVKCALCIVLGALGIIIGGQFTVDNAKIIAAAWGMSETYIGLTIVAFGTSLPELVTSVVAATKGESGLSLGNAIGSNILNILFILGFSASLHPLPVSAENQMDMFVLLGVAIAMFAIAKVFKKIGRLQGAAMLAAYIAYMAYILVR